MCLFCGLVTLLMVGCVYPPLNMDHSSCPPYYGLPFWSSLRRRAIKLVHSSNPCSTKERAARDPLSAPDLSALWSRTAVNMLAEERRCKRRPGWCSIHAAPPSPRLCAPLPALGLPQPQSSQILRAAAWVAPSQPHSRLVRNRTCMSSCGASWARL